jgi:hypothetical protein
MTSKPALDKPIKSKLHDLCASLLEKLSQYRSMTARFILAIAPKCEVSLMRECGDGLWGAMVYGVGPSYQSDIYQ